MIGVIAILAAAGAVFIFAGLVLSRAAKKKEEKYETFRELEMVPVEEEKEEPKFGRKGAWGEVLSFNDRVARIPVVRAFYTDTRSMESIRQKLTWSGNKYNLTPEEFVALRLTSCFGFTLLGVLFYLVFGILPLWAVVIFAVVGYIFPNLRLDSAVDKRQKEILNALPEFIDMLLVITESKTWIEALNEVPRYLRGPLAQEVRELNREIAAYGKPIDALVNFSDRTGVPEVRSLGHSIAQAEIVGQSMGEALKKQAESIRIAHWNYIDGEINKTTTWLALPLVGLMLPALILIALVPAIQILLSSIS